MRDLLLILLTTLRLTRFITTDSLGGWLIADPAHRWADDHEASLRLARERTIWKMRKEHPEMPPAAAERLTRLESTLEDDEPISWQARLVSGLECPYCVGFWIGVGVIGSYIFARRTGSMKAWRIANSAFALNYIVGATSARID